MTPDHTLLFLALLATRAFAFVPPAPAFGDRTSAVSAAPLTSGEGTVGVVGAGYAAVLAAKIAKTVGGFDTWILCPPDEVETFDDVIYGSYAARVEAGEDGMRYVSPEDVEGVLREGKTDAVLMVVDGEGCLRPESTQQIIEWGAGDGGRLKRVAVMSRNLANNQGYGFFARAAKTAANVEIWLGPDTRRDVLDQYKEFEKTVKDTCAANGVDHTIARAGTLKGGGCGEDGAHPQFLTKSYYERTKKDIITWQLLYDCAVRGVTLTKGDVATGPGNTAVLNAVDAKAHAGDTSRGGLAEAIVRSLMREEMAGMDFGVGVAEGREPPTDSEWEALFQSLN
uniref:NAD(P)-binding domain-containing protein n=1 Tax=Corethron hystrix TaxID=216773 RepID=A0A7S1FQU8_9STRA|mmetsp:Transcript_21443/g.48717  ORF Transcript_21443/g.48717 Transcript_21443/m.48717 type:complete len:339 (+) Transcript_21443:135-1151(+)